ncbi:MAG: hypothetical protein ACC662_01015 [Planctomycetota bacterium]
MGASLKHFLERAVARYLRRFDDWFPPGFDYLALCRDLPAVAEANGCALDPEVGDEHDLEAMARSVFSGAHLFTLVVASASAGGAEDPDQVLERLLTPPDDAGEACYLDLVQGGVGPVEERLAASGEPARPGEAAEADVEEAATLVEAVWPAVEHMLASDAGRLFERAGPASPLLWSLARVGAILAAFRWMPAERTEPGWPGLGADLGRG